jgi:hypothetical protein
MRIVRSVAGVVAAVAIAVAPAILSASDRADAPKGDAKVVAAAPSGQFAALKDIKAVPMTAQELRTVKGRDAHFRTVNSQNTGQNGLTSWHFVNFQNRDNWVDLGNGILVGPGYHGLCGAALNSPSIVIPGQNPSTGVGGGC